MTHSHRVISGIDIVQIEESMDLHSVPAIKKFCRSLARHDQSKILLVLDKVHFMDSSGLGMLTNLFFECQQKGIDFKIASLSDELKKMFAFAKFDKSFQIYETQEEAIRDFK